MNVFLHVSSKEMRQNVTRRSDGLPCKPILMVREGRCGEATCADAVQILDAAGNVVAVLRYTPTDPLEGSVEAYVECFHGVNMIHGNPEAEGRPSLPT